MDHFKKWLTEWGMLVMLGLFILMLAVSSITAVNSENKLDQTKQAACHAVVLSDTALVNFLQAQVNLNHQANRLATDAFMSNLKVAYAEAEVTCLQGK